MGLCVTKDRFSVTMHMVLGFNEGGVIQLLDNLSFRIFAPCLAHRFRISWVLEHK